MNLFTQISQFSSEAKDTDAEFEEKMLKKGDGLFRQITTIEEIKEEIYAKEISKVKSNIENEIEIRRRIKHKSIPIGNDLSLFNSLSIDKTTFERAESSVFEIKDLPFIINNLTTVNNLSDQYVSLVAIRKLLTTSSSVNPIQEIIDNGIVFSLINSLDSSYPEIIYEALRCLVSICAGTSDQSNSVVIKGGAKKFISLCDSKYIEIIEQSLIGIGNLASDSVHYRDMLIQLGALNKILYHFKTSTQHRIVKNCLFALQNFAKGTPPSYENMCPFLDYCVNLMIRFSNDQDILSDCVWIIGFMAENYKKCLKPLYDFKVLGHFVRLLSLDNTNIIIPTLRLLGAFIASNAKLTQSVCDSGALDIFPHLLNHHNKRIRKEVCWMVSNIAAGTLIQVETLVMKNYLPILTQVYKNDEPEIQKEAIWAICNFTLVENEELIKSNFNNGILETICLILKMSDPKFIAVGIESLGNLLKCGKTHPNSDGSNPIVIKIEELGMLDVLESLQYNPIQIIYEKTLGLLEQYFDLE